MSLAVIFRFPVFTTGSQISDDHQEMSMELLLLLVWLHVYCICFTFGKLIVTQAPTELNRLKGESVNVTCNWNITDARRIRVEWRKLLTMDENGTLLLSGVWTYNITTFKSNQNRSSHIITNDTAVMTLESITEEDAGRYVCKVVCDIPVLITGQGNGTILDVQTKKDVLGPSQLYPLLAIGCVFPVVIFVGYFMCKLKKRPKRRILQKTEQESIELNHLERDNNDADESASSTNSVTWAISTLYESFDYFAMKNKDEKSAASSGKPDTHLIDPASCSDPVNACPDQVTACSVQITPCSDENSPCYEQIAPYSDGAAT